MSPLSRISRHIPLIIGLLILLAILALAPWGQIRELLEKVPLETFFILTGLSALYYASKAVRFWYILRLLDIRVPFWTTALLYLSGQSVSLLPAGELYRTVLLKKYLGVSMSKSSPSVTIQGLVEAIVLLFFSLAGAFIIGRDRFVVGVVGIFLVLLIVALQRGWFGMTYALINKIPYVSVNQTKFQRFIQDHQDLLAPKPLLSLLAFSVVPVFSGIAILYLSSQAIGFDISYIQSTVGYSLPVIMSGLSFLPGGLGVSEGGSIGMVQFFGASAAAAVTITLLVRIFTLVAGLVYGLAAQLLLRPRKKVV